MPNSLVEKALLSIYDLLWKAAIPVLRKNHRLAEGFAQRALEQPNLMDADLWVQAASAGEAYLAWEILKRIPDDGPLKILLTTNTRQGMEILFQAIHDPCISQKRLLLQAAYFPFDGPALMQKGVRLIRPRVMVLLEGELWPGLLYWLKRSGCRVLLINARITPKSLSRYRIWPSLWRRLRPDIVLAISREDAQRFTRLFGRGAIGTMPNIKFDRLSGGLPATDAENSIDAFLPSGKEFLILGSIRREEESDVARIIMEIFSRRPQTVIGLFPRHMHRIEHWQRHLTRISVPWRLRSELTEPLPDGCVILWDLFGELSPAYKKAVAAFVGGSLAPLGGQNFLEPLMTGVPVVIGPFWDNFKWVGQEIFDRGIVRQAASWKNVAHILIEVIMAPEAKEKIRQRALNYIADRQGGTDIACRLIAESLKTGHRPPGNG